ncbi:MAG: polyprenol monophosphomannose synthase [Methylomonas sp.]
MATDSLVIIPTYNEIENVEKMVTAIMQLPERFDVLFVDDHSPDGTALKIKELKAKFPDQIHLEERSGKLGLGTAYIHGFRWAIARNYPLVFEMDCDFSHDPKDLVRLRKTCLEGADLAIGSRYVKGGKVKNWDRKRLLMSFFASVYVRTILFIGVRDTTAGFKCYKLAVLKSIKLENVTFKGYAFQICMKYAAIKHGFKVKEIPITFIDRLFGESKRSTSICKEAFLGVWKMRKMDL